jgi:FixJ family two-component response regulator
MGRASLNLVVVDDDDDVRTSVARLLRSMGHNVRVFASAEEFEAQPVAADCLIVDVRLPGLSGLELCDRLRTRAPRVPVVLITGEADQLDTPHPMDVPSVTKPFDDDTLMTAIAEAISSGIDER